MNKIIDMIRLLSNCSNTAIYEYTDEDMKKDFFCTRIRIKNLQKQVSR